MLLVFGLTSCTNVKEPEFRRIEKFRLRNFGITEGTIGFDVTYYNPNNFGVAVKEAAADVYLDSVYLGQFRQDSTISVGKNAEFSVPLSGKISLATAMKMDLKNLDTREIQLRADGSVKVGKAGIFVNKPIKYSGRHKLGDIKLTDIRF